MAGSIRTEYLLAIPLGFTSIDEAMCAFVTSHEAFEPHTRWTPLLKLARISCAPKNLHRFERDLTKSLRPYLSMGVRVRSWGVCVGNVQRASLWSRHRTPSTTLSTMAASEDVIRIQRILSGRKFAAVDIALLEPSVDFPAHHRLSLEAWNSIQEADARDETFGDTTAVHECLLIPSDNINRLPQRLYPLRQESWHNQS